MYMYAQKEQMQMYCDGCLPRWTPDSPRMLILTCPSDDNSLHLLQDLYFARFASKCGRRRSMWSLHAHRWMFILRLIMSSEVRLPDTHVRTLAHRPRTPKGQQRDRFAGGDERTCVRRPRATSGACGRRSKRMRRQSWRWQAPLTAVSSPGSCGDVRATPRG